MHQEESEQMDTLCKLQEETAVTISKLLDNTKKESREKRTKELITKRKDQFEQLWKKFIERHESIVAFNKPDHPYFTDKFYDQVEKIKINADTVLKSFTATLSEKGQTDDNVQQRQNQLVVQNKESCDEKLLLMKKQKLRIESFTDLVNEIRINEAMKTTVIEYYTRTLAEAWEKLEALNEEIQLKYKAEDEHDQEVLQATEKYENTKKKYRSLVILLQEKKHEAQNTHAQDNDVRLPRLTIPTFDGRYESWTAFHDIFMRLIHTNHRLADIEKMQYLKTNLKGEAYKLLSHLEITQANYATAWEMINNRYNNKRKLIGTHVQTLFAQPKLENESSTGIKRMHDTTKECIYALNNLGIDTSTWAPIISHIIIQKLDQDSHKLYEQSLDNPKEAPTLEAIFGFLENRFQSLEALKDTRRKESVLYQRNESKSVHKPKYRNYYTTFEAKKCVCCQGIHPIYSCSKFKALSLQQRYDFVAQNNLCTNCLNHSREEKCLSKKRCITCNRPHHSILHRPYDNTGQPQPSNKAGVPKIQANFSNQGVNVLLATALIRAKKNNGQYEFLRALIDPGSQASFISEAAAQLLALPRTKINATISGMGEAQAGIARNKVDIEIQPRFKSAFSLTYSALVLSRLTKLLPNQHIKPINQTNVLDVIADPKYDIPGPIDLIIGADIYGKIILDGIYKEDSGVVAQRTELGWIISGQMNDVESHYIKVTTMVSHVEIEEQLQKFWEI